MYRTVLLSKCCWQPSRTITGVRMPSHALIRVIAEVLQA